MRVAMGSWGLSTLAVLASCASGAPENRPATVAASGSGPSAPPPPAATAPTVGDAGAPPEPPAPPSFDDDVAFLGAHGSVIVLTGEGGAKVALSPQYQGRVMTSAVGGPAASLGWINRRFIEAGKTGTQFDNYGGEDRFWLGPEGGQYGLYFPPGGPFTFDAWQTPHAFQEGAWDVKEQKPDRVTFAKSMTVTNWTKADFSVDVDRTARLLSRNDAKAVLGLAAALPPSIGFVAFETKNRITNTGKAAWTKDKGLLSIWILAMFSPASDGRVVIPFETKLAGEIVNDRYFGKVAPARLAIHEDKGFLAFTCDGKERGKIGLGPRRAKSVLGSYSPASKLLTIVHYDGPKGLPGRGPSTDRYAPYVNSMWEQQKEPYAGDVVNSYNDGPPAPGKPPLGGFYEIETSSEAAALAPHQSLVHTHRTFHFVGEPDVLEPIAKKVLGVSLAEITGP